jgi:small neutral amino acid transporter SnatA (MarC family)
VRTFIVVLAAVNPPAVAAALAGSVRAPIVAAGACTAWVVAVALACVSGPILDALDVSSATFEVAAGIVLGLVSARVLVVGVRVERNDGTARTASGLIVPVLIPVLLTPQLLMVAVAAGALDGSLLVAVSAAIVLVAATVAATVSFRTDDVVWSVTSRIVAALGLAVAVGLAVDGVQSI